MKKTFTLLCTATLAAALMSIATGCVSYNESQTYDPSLGPAYDMVNKPKKMKKAQGTFYSDQPGGAGSGPHSYYSQ